MDFDLRKFVLAALLAALSSFAVADTWPAAGVKAAVSEDAGTVFRVIPGKSIGDVVGFAGSPKGEFAQGQWFRFRDNRYELYQTTILVNPVAPVYIAVANDGTTVTIDNWHNVGFGDVVAIYHSNGKLLKKYRLTDLYPISAIEKMKRSVSSIWWRCETSEPYLERNGVLEFDDSLGGRFEFRLKSGQFNYIVGAGMCKQ